MSTKALRSKTPRTSSITQNHSGSQLPEISVTTGLLVLSKRRMQRAVFVATWLAIRVVFQRQVSPFFLHNPWGVNYFVFGRQHLVCSFTVTHLSQPHFEWKDHIYLTWGPAMWTHVFGPTTVFDVASYDLVRRVQALMRDLSKHKTAIKMAHINRFIPLNILNTLS